MKHSFTLKGLTYLLKYEKLGPATRVSLHIQGGAKLYEAGTVCSLKDHYSPLKGRKIATARVLVKNFKNKEDREAIWSQLLSK
jgi:hypothetical protein